MVQRGQQKGWDVVGSVQAWQGVTTRHVQWRRAQVGDDAQIREGFVVQDRSAQVFQRSGGKWTWRGCVTMEIVEITAVGSMVAGEGGRSWEVFCNDGGGRGS